MYVINVVFTIVRTNLRAYNLVATSQSSPQASFEHLLRQLGLISPLLYVTQYVSIS